MEIGSIADWIGVGLTIIALVVSIRVDWEHFRNISPYIAKLLRMISTVLLIVLVAVFAFRLGSSYEADGNLDTNLVSVEDFPGEVYSYISPDVYAYGELKVIRKLDGDLDYRLYYSVLPDPDSWAGIFFYFSPTQDLTRFKDLQITINFNDDQARCSVFLQDLHERKSFIILGNNRIDNASTDAQMVIQGNNRIFTIPLANNFLQDMDSNPINKQSIVGIGFGMDGSAFSGEYNCTIEDIFLLK